MTDRVRTFLREEPRIGLSDSGQVSSGYDGIEWAIFADEPDNFVDAEDLWTAEERQQLADVMIARWTAFRNRCAPETPTPPKETKA